VPRAERSASPVIVALVIEPPSPVMSAFLIVIVAAAMLFGFFLCFVVYLF
jgi:hypothetical protein